MKIYVDCIGCEQRKLDAQFVIDYITSCGGETSKSPQECDYAVLVTCAVDRTSENESVNRLDSLSRAIPKNARLVVGGCLPSISPGKISEYKIHATFSPRNNDSLSKVFERAESADIVSYPNRSTFDSRGESSESVSAREEYESAKRGFKVTINDGCLSKCSYCVIRDATGKLKSKDPKYVIDQVKRGVSEEEKTIMLLGGDTGAYGVDIGTGFHDLLRSVLEIPGDYGLFIHDFNVNWLIRNRSFYLDVFSSENGKKIKSANFPIQSGSNRILRFMKRPYTSEEVVDSLKSVKDVAPHMKQGTHVMVGFPGEGEHEFSETVSILNEINFDFITCFPYSEHKSADSAKLDGKVSVAEVNERIDRLTEEFREKIKVIW